MLGILLVVGVGMYFIMIRPARKQQQRQQEMMNALEEGTRVMTGSGIYGTIRHLGEKQAVLEISPGVDLTVARAIIQKVIGPEEEEFEYSSEIGYQPIEDNMVAFEADLATEESGSDPEQDQSTDESENNDNN